MQAALDYEAQRFSEMAATPESESLIGLFEGSTALKKNRFGKPAKKVCVARSFYFCYRWWCEKKAVTLTSRWKCSSRRVISFSCSKR